LEIHYFGTIIRFKEKLPIRRKKDKMKLTNFKEKTKGIKRSMRQINFIQDETCATIDRHQFLKNSL
jgi:hypothetical protein